MSIHVETQGISADYTAATGEYEAIDRGTMSEADLANVLAWLARLELPPAPPGADLCPPHVLATGPQGVLSFTGAATGVYCAETEETLTPAEAARLVARGAGSAPPGGRGKRKYKGGHVPVRMTHLEPTSESTRAEQVDRSRPVFDATVDAEDRAAAGGFWCGIAAIGVGALILGLLIASREWDTTAGIAGIVSLLVGVPLFLWGVKGRKEPLRAGVCWNTNCVWIERGGRRRLTGDANCISRLEVTATSQRRRTTRGAYATSTTYPVLAHYSGGRPEPITTFHSESEARMFATLVGNALAAAGAGGAPPAAGSACTRCGAAARPGTRFCNGCGARLA